MTFATAIETKALPDLSLRKRTAPSDWEAWASDWSQRVANLCLYYCIRIQQRPNDQCYGDCKLRFKCDPNPAYEMQAMADQCYEKCMKGRQSTPEEQATCSQACGEEWMQEPNTNLAISQQKNPAGEKDVDPKPASTSPNLAATLGYILSAAGKEAGNDAASHAAETLQWFGHTFRTLDGGLLAGGPQGKGGGRSSGMPPPAPLGGQLGTFRSWVPLAP
ncbi:MAG: hypothetical protein M1816_000325 [Peltula sp. TS41687]|nr:MAG: hypothetical protein M1816_000325 [Peltula sp. TS41687]